MLKAVADRDGYIQVLSEKGLLRTRNGQFLFPGTLVPDLQDKPLSDKKVTDVTVSGNQLVYVVSAVGTEGRYDLYVMNSDGSGNHNITPGYFPAAFLCCNAVFSLDDSKIYFVGRWWP